MGRNSEGERIVAIIPPADLEALSALAERQGTSRLALIRKAVRKLLEAEAGS